MHKRFFIAGLLSLASLVNTAEAASQFDAPLQPYQKTLVAAVWNGSGSISTIGFAGSSWGIPDGKVLVIEHVSAKAVANPGEKIALEITCQGSGALSNLGLSQHELILTSAGQFEGLDRFVGGSPLSCYTSNAMIAVFVRNSSAPINGAALAQISVTGFLADPAK